MPLHYLSKHLHHWTHRCLPTTTEMDSRLLLFLAIACAVSRIDGQTITTFTGNITRSGCGTTKLCPTTCDPSVNTTTNNCFFGSAQLQSNNSLFFELSGITPGYVALGLDTSPSLGPSIIFVCGNNISNTPNSTFFFASVSNTSSGLTTSNTSSNTVYTVQGAVTSNVSQNQSLVQCTFNTSSTLTITRSTATTFYVYILSGTISGSTLNSPVTQFRSNTLLDLSSPTGNTTTASTTASTNTTTTTTTTTAKPTTSGNNALANPLAHALAILLSAMGLLLLY